MYAGATYGGGATGGGSSAASADEAAPTLNAVANAKRFHGKSPRLRGAPEVQFTRVGIGMPLQECNGSAKNVSGLDWSLANCSTLNQLQPARTTIQILQIRCCG
jgi:hypothetical protein